VHGSLLLTMVHSKRATWGQTRERTRSPHGISVEDGWRESSRHARTGDPNKRCEHVVRRNRSTLQEIFRFCAGGFGVPRLHGWHGPRQDL